MGEWWAVKGEAARLRGIASRAGELPSAVREGGKSFPGSDMGEWWAVKGEAARLRGTASRAGERPSAVREGGKSLHRECFWRSGGPCRIRTFDQKIKSLLLYRLS